MGLPLSQSQAVKASRWMKDNFQGEILDGLKGTSFSLELVLSIFCQETAQRVILWVDDYEAILILERCVFDASGDFPNTSRGAFPRNKLEFETKYGKELTDDLVIEANKMRKMPQPNDPDGYGAASYLYKGYGIFQYDLQNIVKDEMFFRNKLWYYFNFCMDRLVKELKLKQAYSKDEFDTIKHYNGSGKRAEEYAKNVTQFMDWV